jgi:hypothetical protein
MPVAALGVWVTNMIDLPAKIAQLSQPSRPLVVLTDDFKQRPRAYLPLKRL